MAKSSKKEKETSAVPAVRDECPKETLDEIWQNNPIIIRQYLDIRRDYDQLCTEVEYILRKQVINCEIEISSISSRAKTLNSFLEKIQRKNYDNSFEQLTDLAGVRVVLTCPQ